MEHEISLTELEGAILTEIGFRNRVTAFQVRQAFKNSASSEWRGSAGSVYPAIERLVRNGFVDSVAGTDARGTRILSVTAAGFTTLHAWQLDLTKAISIGMDSFRLRAGLWSLLPAADRAALAQQLQQELKANIALLLVHKKNEDALEGIQTDLAIALQKQRLSWIGKYFEPIQS